MRLYRGSFSELDAPITLYIALLFFCSVRMRTYTYVLFLLFFLAHDSPHAINSPIGVSSKCPTPSQ